MKYKIILLLITIIVNFSSLAEIFSANNVMEINNSILSSIENRNAAKTLVIMPLKDFMTQPTDKAFYANDEKSLLVISKAIKKIKSSASSYLDELILTEYPNKLADEYIPNFIQNLQNKNVPIIVTSRNVSGSFNKIKFLEVWTWKYLYDHGIDLSKSPLGANQIIFNKQFNKIKGTYPTFFKGLLSCNSQEGENSPQSIIMSLLIVSLKWMPDVVYVIDKDVNYIKSIILQFKSLRPDIQVLGFVYAPPKPENITLEIKELTNFWHNLVTKLNSITRKETKDKQNPYE